MPDLTNNPARAWIRNVGLHLKRLRRPGAYASRHLAKSATTRATTSLHAPGAGWRNSLTEAYQRLSGHPSRQRQSGANGRQHPARHAERAGEVGDRCIHRHHQIEIALISAAVSA